MRGKITVIGNSQAADALAADPRFEVTRLSEPDAEQLAGSDLVLVAQGVDMAEAARATARRAPAAVLLLETGPDLDDCEVALGASLLPRPRVFGVDASDAVAAGEAVLFDRETTLQVFARCRGELGIEDRVAQVPATVARGGLRKIGE
jgi:malate/lactate dehydrogenase